ncbi:MAG: DEAD/DEAH box helicase [Sporichthyaceae bacterium]|nr:DEAD/DEAH box helicase [Sporichthyaceae bacterium]
MTRDVATSSGTSPANLLESLLIRPGRKDRVTHVEWIPAREGQRGRWPDWVSEVLLAKLAENGLDQPWTHQVEVAEAARAGRSVVVSTGTASGKSLAFLVPAITTLLESSPGGGSNATGSLRAGAAGGGGRNGAPALDTVLYLAPTKALAADQARAIRRLQLEPHGVRAATLDGDTATEERDWIRSHANYVLTNPDMLHRSVLPSHSRWSRLLRGVRYVVVDECHVYRGVFGSHVAQVLRRLRRVCARYGAEPTFILASATVSEPGAAAGRLVGVPVSEVTADGSPRGETAFVLWEPPLTKLRGEHGAPVRRTVTAESADLLADLVVEDARTLAFHRSRRGAELAAVLAKQALSAVDPSLPARVAAYRGGYLPEERRALEHDLQRGELLGLATTTALELGVDVAGLDAVLLAGYPGTRASMWQQAGRAGRAGQGSLAVLLARDDPLDTYLVTHPEALFGPPVESTVLDPDNPYVLAPHLCAAAAELPLTEDDLELFGPATPALVAELTDRGLLRRRSNGWYWTRSDRASALADIRGAGGNPVQVVEHETGRLLGTVDPAAAHSTVHRGAVYVHQGETYLVRDLDLEDAAAVVERAQPDYSTTARDVTDIRIIETLTTQTWKQVTLCFGSVEVSSQVVSYLRKRLITGEILGEEPLDLPPRRLRTRAVWWTVPEDVLVAAGIELADLPGAAHAAEHAAIGLLPLFATCDRWDIGGVSTALHADTAAPTIFVYDGHPGGAGFAERGHATATRWLRATRDMISACTCLDGCPSCIQSPKCGNGNNPLHKAGAIRVLDVVVQAAPD